MPRPNLGPKLTTIRKPGWTRAIFYITWTEGGRTRVHGTGYDAGDPVSAEAAQAYFEDWLRKRARARRKGPADPGNVRVVDVITDYLAEHGAQVAATATMRFAARSLIQFFREDTMASVTPVRVRAYWEWRRRHSIRVLDADARIMEVVERDTRDGTIIRELAGTLRPAIQHAIKQRRLAPGAYHIPVPSSPPGREVWITRSEAAKLLWESRRDLRSRRHLPLYVMIALYTGQRRGAILDLTWRQVDLDRGRIDFNPPGRARTRKGRPIIPIPRALMLALRRAHRRASSDFVVAYHGEKIADVKTGFNSAASRAGLRGVTSHTLRHTAGTWMAQAGVPLREIAGYLGHSEQRTTELYAHHHPDYMAGAKEAFDHRK